MFCPKCGVENLNTSKFCKKCGKNLPDASQIRQVSPPQFGYAPPSQTGNLLGQILDGKYRIEARLGTGGMGDVYRATRMLIGDSVAIKILHPHLARDAQAAERFRREAVTATQLRHRNIVALYDVGISAAHNVPFILMELAEGFSLRQIINQYRVLPLDFVVTVTAQLCAALDEAHRLGIVHRDIKPENIIANQTANGWHVKVLDFGIAKLYNQTDLGLTQDGSAMGTPQYMSPEQCLGEALDGRSDIYSVGILLYEMLAGTVPFKSPAASAIAVHQVQTPPAPPSSLNSGIAPQVEAVVLRALDKRREQRPQTASQLAQEMIQAATVAFKAGIAPVSATPIAAPDVEPEFDAAGEAENPPPASHTLSSEILVEKEPAPDEIQNGEQEILEIPEPIEAPTKKIKLGKKVRKNKTLSEPAKEETPSKEELPVVSDVSDETPDDSSVEREDLTLVFEDAEHILDEMFPNEAMRNPLPAKAGEIDSQTARPIEMPSDELPPPEDPPEDVLAKYQAETVLPHEIQKTDIEPAAAPVSAPPTAETAEIVPAPSMATAPEIVPEPSFSGEIQSKPANQKLLILGTVGAVIFVVLGGFLTYWLLSSYQKSASANPGPAANKPADSTKPPAGMAYVPGGEFLMGSDDGDEFSRPAHKISVKPFFIDLTEVTNEEYKKFVDATGNKAPSNWKNNNFPDGKAKFPVTGVDWDAANAFAKWAGKRLPTEAEWEFAARGTDNRIYPWGTDWKKESANADKQTNGMAEVGKFSGRSPFGLSDMSGNAWEWTATDAIAYPNGKMLPNESIEPKIIRGGYFGSSKDNATAVFRRPYGARGQADGYENMSFRCVKDISEK